MANEIWVNHDMAKGLVDPHQLAGLTYTGSNAGDTFGVHILRNSVPSIELAGRTVTGYLIRPDQQTVVIAGAISGSDVTVTLPSEAYAYSGRCSLVIRVSDTDGVKIPVFAAYFNIGVTSTDEMIDPGELIPSLEDLLAQIDAMEAATNAAQLLVANYQDRMSVAVVKSVNLYNKTTRNIGLQLYADGSEHNNADYDTSDYIQVTPSVRYYAGYWVDGDPGAWGTSQQVISICVFYDANKTLITPTIAADVLRTTGAVAPANAAFMRFSINRGTITNASERAMVVESALPAVYAGYWTLSPEITDPIAELEAAVGETGDKISDLKSAFTRKNVCADTADIKASVIYFPVYLEQGQAYTIQNPSLPASTQSILLAIAPEDSSTPIVTIVNYGYVYNPVIDTRQNFTWTEGTGWYRFKFGLNRNLTETEKTLYGANWVIMPISSATNIVFVNEYIPYTDVYAKRALVADALSEPNRTISCIGDSLTEGYGVSAEQSYPALLATLTRKNVYNAGISGEASNTICARTGGYPAKIVNVTIPASTDSVVLTFTDNINIHAAQPTMLLEKSKASIYNPVTIDGIVGSVSKVDGVVYFTRASAGTAKTINRPIVAVTNQMANHRDDIQVIWIGTNGGWMVTADDAQTRIDNLIGQIDLIIDYSTSKQYVIIGLTYYYSWVEVNGLTRDMLDNAMKLHFGPHFINARKYLMEYGLSDAGITPDAADTAAIAAGNVPPHLLIEDGIHGNSYFYNIIANLVYKKGTELGYWD